MKFRLETARDEYADDEKALYEAEGFVFAYKPYPEGMLLDGKPYCWILANKPIIEINTLDELMALCKRTKCDLVVGERNSEDDNASIYIYDGYLE